MALTSMSELNPDDPPSKSSWRLHVVMGITLGRLLLLPAIGWALASASADQPAWLALSLYIVAICTDWLDGSFARRWQVTTPLGAMFDETVDKIFTSLILLILAANGRLGLVGLIAASMLIARDFLISGLRYHWAKQPSLPTNVNYLGKIKTFCLMMALGIYFMNWQTLYSDLVLCIATLISWLALQRYVQRAIQIATKNSNRF